MPDLHCWFEDGLNTNHPGTIIFYPEWNKALCKPCERWYALQRAKREHPSSPRTLKLVAPDMVRCLHHDRDDRYTCPECQAVLEDRAVFLND